MKRAQILLCGLLAVMLVGALAVWSASSSTLPVASKHASSLPPVAETVPETAPDAGTRETRDEPAASPDIVAEWGVDAFGADAAKRAAAIAKLAQAPRAQALPVLHRVLSDGEPLVDRPLALRALQELALNQGDTDGAVRAAVREVIYHGDDETLAASAQDTLDTIEESEMK